MDLSSAKWSSQLELELEDSTLIHNSQMKSSMIDEAKNSIAFFGHGQIYSTEAYQTKPSLVVRPPSALTLCTISKETSFHEVPSPTAAVSTQFISFGKANPDDPSPSQNYGLMPRITVQKEAEMICFCVNSPSNSSHQFGTMDYGQPIKKGGGVSRTPLQAKHHVIAERKRREKLLQQFIALSAVVPGLMKLNRISIMDGAIHHLKQLEDRFKALEEGLAKGSSSSVEQKPCIIRGYNYEEEPSPAPAPTSSDHHRHENVSKATNYDHDPCSYLKNIQIRILKGDVLIRVTCENRTRLSEEEFVSGLIKLNLSVTNSKFIRFEGNSMLAISAVAKMKEGFRMTEEALADATRLAILKLI